MLLVSWNVAGRVRLLEQQVQRLLALGPDLICLQEITASTLPLWRERLQDAGYPSVVDAKPAKALPRARPRIVISAGRAALRSVAVAGVPWPERVLATRLSGGLELVNFHSPISTAPDLVKVHTHLAVYRHLARDAKHARVLCGDLNTPRKELSDGRVWTFARDRHGRIRPERGEEWDRAELALIRGLKPFGFFDALRSDDPARAGEISWGWARWKGGYRLDHLLVAGLAVQECRYEHSWREEGLSDHSAVVGRLVLAPASPPRRREGHR
jgi:exonuclease III